MDIHGQQNHAWHLLELSHHADSIGPQMRQAMDLHTSVCNHGHRLANDSFPLQRAIVLADIRVVRCSLAQPQTRKAELKIICEGLARRSSAKLGGRGEQGKKKVKEKEKEKKKEK